MLIFRTVLNIVICNLAVLEAAFHIRLEFYVKRKKVQLDNLQLDLLKLDNKVRFILGVVEGEIIVNNRKRAELLLELKNKGFTPFPKKTKTVEAAIAGALPDVEESPEENTETAKGVRAGDYEYLLSMAIGTLTLEKVQQLCAERDKLREEVEELKKETPKSLWSKDLDAFIRELDAQDMQEAKDDEYELKNMGSDAARIFRQVGKNSGKNTKRTISAEKADSQSTTNSQTSTATGAITGTQNEKKLGAAKSKRGGGKKAAAKKPMEVESDEDDELDSSLRDRLVAYNNNGLSTDQSAIEDNGSKQNSSTEDSKPKPKEPARRTKKVAPVYVDTSGDDDDYMKPIPEEEEEEEEEKQSKKAAANEKKAANGRGKKAMVVSDSDSDFGIESDYGSDYQAAIPTKGGRKPGGDKPTKAPKTNSVISNSTSVSVPAAKEGPKRVPQGQKLIDEMLRPAIDDGLDVIQASPDRKSPQKKVRQMRPSPFNKKSGLKLNQKKDTETTPPSAEGSAGSSFSPDDEVNEVPKPTGRNRPQRATRAPVHYVLSDSDEDDEDEATEYSVFLEEDDV
eukprot:Gb_12824 [translate_table: standard]